MTKRKREGNCLFVLHRWWQPGPACVFWEGENRVGVRPASVKGPKATLQGLASGDVLAQEPGFRPPRPPLFFFDDLPNTIGRTQSGVFFFSLEFFSLEFFFSQNRQAGREAQREGERRWPGVFPTSSSPGSRTRTARSSPKSAPPRPRRAPVAPLPRPRLGPKFDAPAASSPRPGRTKLDY